MPDLHLNPRFTPYYLTTLLREERAFFLEDSAWEAVESVLHWLRDRKFINIDEILTTDLRLEDDDV